MKIVWFLSFVVLAACASHQPKGVAYDTASFENIVTKRAPAASEEETYQAYRHIIFESTKIRIAALKDQQIDKICNAINSPRGSDTFVYYISFEILKVEDQATARLRKEYGPFLYRNFVQMHEQRLPYKLHEACTAKNRGQILSAMRNIEGVYNQE